MFTLYFAASLLLALPKGGALQVKFTVIAAFAARVGKTLFPGKRALADYHWDGWH